MKGIHNGFLVHPVPLLLYLTSISLVNLIRQGNLTETMSICQKEMNKERRFSLHEFIDAGFKLVL